MINQNIDLYKSLNKLAEKVVKKSGKVERIINKININYDCDH